MKGAVWGLAPAIFLMLAGCATNPNQTQTDIFYEKFYAHCRDHSREMTAEVDEEERYNECMAYFTNIALNCPDCEIDSHLSDSK